MGILLELGDFGFGANSSDGGFAGARDHEGTGDELIALVFCNTTLFAGNVGFVNFYGTRFYSCIDDNLVAETKNDEITLHKIFGGDLDGFAFPDDGGILLRDEFELVDSVLGTNFVNDAD